MADYKANHKSPDVEEMLTMSMGLSTLLPNVQNSMKTIMAEANNALLAAAASGKNQINMY